MKLDIYKIFIAVLNGTADQKELEQFKLWIDTSKTNENQFQQFKRIWNNSEPFPITELPDLETEWNKLENNIKVLENNRVKKITPRKIFSFNRRNIFKFVYRPAVAEIAVLLILAVYLFFKISANSIEPRYKIIQTSNKEIKEVLLSDGTKINLNSGSRIEYYEPLKQNSREIKLRGEAFFSVKKDNRPFIIFCDNAYVKVLGTKFNVRTRDNQTRVVVKEGKVNFASKLQNDGAVILIKNQMSNIYKGNKPGIPENVDIQNYTGWMEGKLIFDHASLTELKDEFERFYNIGIELDSNVSKDYSLTGSFNFSDAESTIEMVCLTLNLDFSYNGKRFLIKEKSF